MLSARKFAIVVSRGGVQTVGGGGETHFVFGAALLEN